MFTHIAIHYPKPAHYHDLLASMRRLDAAAQGTPGLIQIGDWTEVDGGTRLVGIATWDSREAFEHAAPSLFATVSGDPHELWREKAADNLFVERD